MTRYVLRTRYVADATRLWKGDMVMDQFNETMKINNFTDNSQKVREIMSVVYDALQKKGYNPLNQIVAYLMSGDPTYITGYNNARILIGKLERDEILEELTKEYLKSL